MLEMCGPAPATVVTRQDIEANSVIVIGTVATVTNSQARIVPEAYLKGPVSAADVVIQSAGPGCAAVPLKPGERVLLMLAASNGELIWPQIDSPGAYLLEDGRAASLGSVSGQNVDNAPTEAEVVDHIRGITEQYAVPAHSDSEGASLGWIKVVLPVALVTLAVFGIGLYLMKIWHRIDPT